MIEAFQVGDKKTFKKKVTDMDAASFDSGEVHPVYATFALGRDAEWACRLFVLEMKEEKEEGIGTFLNIKHHSPALIGDEVCFTAEITSLKGNSIDCSFKAEVGKRLIATGSQGQKIIKKEKIEKIFKELR